MTKDEMKARIEDLERDNTALQAQLREAVDNPDLLQELNAKIQLQEEILADQDQAIQKLEATVATLSPKAQANASANAPVIQLDGVSYRVIHGVSLTGFGKLTPDDIAGNEAAALELVKIGSGALQALDQ